MYSCLFPHPANCKFADSQVAGERSSASNSCLADRCVDFVVRGISPGKAVVITLRRRNDTGEAPSSAVSTRKRSVLKNNKDRMALGMPFLG